ncbi:hypothetical protein JCM10908_004503, partial [Rhodotorula pacifica]|uniref:uncharacterized protein n=1 Tax=Rhodotorula pacifica TaxID=1495444 RepID=UPI00316B994C
MPSSPSPSRSWPARPSSPTPNPPSSPAAAARPRISKPRRTLSNRISHLVSRFEPVPPTLAEPLLSVRTHDVASSEVEEVSSHRDQVDLLQQARAATGAEIQDDAALETSRRLAEATVKSEPRVRETGDASSRVKADSARAPLPTAAKSPPTHPLADGDRSTTVRSLPTYGETLRNDAHGAQSDVTPAISTPPMRDIIDEKGDLGFSNPFDDIFAAHDDLDDPLLTHLLRDSASYPPCPAPADSPSLTPKSSTHSVPLYRVFARDAEPLVLPGLDNAINALGGAAHFTPMPELSSEGDFWRAPKLASLESERTQAEATGGSDEGKVGTPPPSSAEWAGWVRWVREGPPQSRWTRFSASLSSLSPFRRRTKRSDPLDEAAQRARLTTEQYKRSLIFPPFHLLPPGVTVTDLKANRRKSAPLFTWQTILKIVGNGILGAAGSSTGISLTTIEGLRDLMQLVTLLVSTSGSPLLPASHAVEPPTGALRTVFVTVPAFLSLDFVIAYGRPFVFLLVLTVVTVVALCELMRFTGGWQGPGSGLKRGRLDRGEGFDREATVQARHSWRDSRVWHIVVTFWCSSVYLPLSKLAIGALVFTDDYWPVANPYLASGQDTPNPSPLGPDKEFYAPLEFCYRTTMRSDTINLAFVLLPVAGIVILALSIWLPWRLRSVINHEKPRVDAWTELGERRRDRNAEYQRLLETDPSPFSFLYK